MSFHNINFLRANLAEERFQNLPGEWFGNVKVIGFAESNSSGIKRVLVRCRCGNEYPITATYLYKRGKTQCQRCSQIIKNRGTQGYQVFLKEGKYKIIKKDKGDHFRGTKYLRVSV